MQSNYEIVRVPLSRNGYEIEIGAGNLAHIGPLLVSCGDVSRCEILTDENVNRLYAKQVAELITDYGIDVDLRVVTAGEESKSVATIEAVWDAMLEDGVDRKTVLVTVGGGVIGDLGGFAAATFARGIRFLQVPTTLLAQVDSSVGGKVGVNLEKAKNMVGAFHQPIAVLIDTDTLNTLDDVQYRSGLGEVVKYAESLDADFFAVLENHVEGVLNREPVFLRKMIARCCQIKAEIVLQDERETTGLRAKLNYGHTFAHAFEACYGLGVIPHGLAVSVGSVYAARLAQRLGRISGKVVDRIIQLHQALNLPTTLEELSLETVKAQVFLDAMLHDKKAEHGKLRFVLPSCLGTCELVDGIDIKEVKSVMPSPGSKGKTD